jgi:hypothetical protein
MRTEWLVGIGAGASLAQITRGRCTSKQNSLGTFNKATMGMKPITTALQFPPAVLLSKRFSTIGDAKMQIFWLFAFIPASSFIHECLARRSVCV